MSDNPRASGQHPPVPFASAVRLNFGLAGAMALSFALNFLRIGKEGFGDRYYAAAVKSMLAGFHNFFFASFDPGGFVTVDKPALGLWLQTLSAKIFGFHGWALILPQALAAALSVGLLYRLVKKAWGPSAGLAAALILAVSPISVAVSRTNQLDSLLVAVLLLAAGAVLAAAERASLKWLLVAMVLVGLGFNIKMLAAYTALPAIVAVYFFGTGLRFRTRIGHLALAAVVLLAVSLSWAVIVDLTPKDRRPYVDNSRNNTELELIVDWNGINRLIPQWLRRGRGGVMVGGGLGMRGGGRPGLQPFANNPSAAPSPGTATGAGVPPQKAAPGPGARAGGPGAGMAGEGGRAGILRLFNRELGGQIGWLIVFGLVGAGAAVLKLRRPLFRDAASRSLLLWLVWFFAMAAYFSTAGFFHRYYLCLIAPSIAALGGLAFVNLRDHIRDKSWRSWLFPLAVLATAGVQIELLQAYPGWNSPLIFALGSLCLVSSEMLVFPKFRGTLGPGRERAAVALGLAGLLVAPLVWSMTPLIFGGTPSMPAAGPELAGGAANAGPGPGAPRVMTMMARLRMGAGAGRGLRPGFAAARPANDELRTTNLMKFAQSHRRGEKFILAVPTARQAWDIILETGAPVMAMGGFMGSDRILTPEKIERMVKAGDIRYFLVRKMPALPAGLRSLGQRFAPGRAAGPGPVGGPRGGGEAQLAIEKWIEEHGRPVPGAEWMEEDEMNRAKAVGPPSPRALAFPGRAFLGQMARGGAFALYDLKPITDDPK